MHYSSREEWVSSVYVIKHPENLLRALLLLLSFSSSNYSTLQILYCVFAPQLWGEANKGSVSVNFLGQLLPTGEKRHRIDAAGITFR